MKKDLLEEIHSLPPLPSSVFELNEYKNIGNTNTTELISIIGKDPRRFKRLENIVPEATKINQLERQ